VKRNSGGSVQVVGLLLLSGSLVHSQEALLLSSAIEVQMRAVSLHLDRFTVLDVRSLRGQMLPTSKDRPVTFDDVNSFVTRINSAEIAMDVKTLSDLLNRRVFAYPGAPLKNISVTVERGRIKQTGIIRKGIEMPFEIEGTLDATPAGEIRLRVDKIVSAHLPVKGLLHFFGEDLSKLITLKQDRGVTVEGDTILLHPDRMLPPPRIEGKVTAVRIEGDRIVLTFGSGATKNLSPPYAAGSYMYHRGGILRFGKLTMSDADLEIVSESQHTPFDFSLPDYNRQLAAGYSKNTISHGLIVFMRDFSLLRSEDAQKGGAVVNRKPEGRNHSVQH
jgi:hypothetical protein